MARNKTFAPKDDDYHRQWEEETDVDTLETGDEYGSIHNLQQEPFMEAPAAASAGDPEIIEAFRKANPKLSEYRLKLWVKQSIDRGWELGMPVPDYNKPTITFNGKGQLVVECPDFRGQNGAFNTASKFLPKNVGAIFWWKHRASGATSSYKLDYSSDKAAQNLKLHEKAKDVDFELLERVSGDTSDYNILKGIKAYSDKLLSEALVRMIARAQAQLYPDDLKKQTGVLDADTIRFAAQLDTATTAASKAEDENTTKVKADTDAKKGRVHDWLNAAIKKLQDEITGPVPEAIRIAEFVGSIPGSPIPHIPDEFIYRISQHLMLGFLQQLASKPESEIDSRLVNVIMAPYKPETMAGQMMGIFKGILQWIKDTVVLIWDILKGLVTFPYKAIKYAATDLVPDMKKLGDKAAKAFAWVESHKEEILSFLKDMMSGSGKDMNDLSAKIKEKAYQMAEGLGGGIAEKLYDFAGKTPYEMGETIGKVEGYLIPDILLAIFSEGIGTAIRESLLAIEKFIELGRAGRVTLEVLKAAKLAYTAITEFIESAQIFTQGAYKDVQTALKDMIESVGELLGIEEKGLKGAEGAEKLAEETKALGKIGTKADDEAIKKADKTAEEEMEKSGEKDAKKAEAETQILAEAIVIADVDDTGNVPITVAMKELDRLAAESRDVKVSFEDKRNGPYYEIRMKGSDFLVDKEYGKGGKKKKSDKTASEKDLEKHEWEGKYYGEPIKLPGVQTEEIEYFRRNRTEYDALRSQFRSSVKGDFCESLAKDPEMRAKLTKAGLTDQESTDFIAKLTNRENPSGYEVHHKIPLDDGGTNDFSNLVLIKVTPYHSAITTYQRAATKGLGVLESRFIKFPIVPGKFYSPPYFEP